MPLSVLVTTHLKPIALMWANMFRCLLDHATEPNTKHFLLFQMMHTIIKS